MEYLLVILVIIALILYTREFIINSFKTSYYEAELKNRDVDISHIENITLKEIVKL